MKCRLILCENYDPFFNMAFDYYFWKNSEEPKNPPVLRFYKWSPSAVSYGYNQDKTKLINLQFCQKNNISVVMRPTGGSAIFHDIEITYSFSSNLLHHPSFSSPTLSYIILCQGLINGIKKLGIELKIRRISEGKEPSFTDIPCFSLSSRHDVVFNDKKIIGSAQRRNKLSFLQHGSILIDIRKNLWENIFLRGVEFSKIGCLNELVFVDRKKLIEFLKEGISEILNFEIYEDCLKKEEKEEIEIIEKKLKREGKYE
ncbi:MAG: lipoate--protein ligase family protein [Candidatus Omnitrophica bacterium]|nr:lipoate--protein ligase family protein [Candidatus Omnitrophota bacterium]MCM8801971.1 lipoate--protein ligase family protein [Candidatus Omnitrophota bacterium]